MKLKATELIGKVLAQSKDKKLKEVCKQNLKKIKGKRGKEKVSFNKNQYIPQDEIMESTGQFMLDDTDPLFPKNVQMFLTKKGMKMIFENGNQSFTLWLEKNNSLDVKYGNTYVIDQVGGGHLWALVGA